MSTSKSKNIKFLRCTFCNKEIWPDMMDLHLNNVHGHNSNETMEKIETGLFNLTKKRREKKKFTIQPKLTRVKQITESDCDLHYFIADDIIFKNHEIEIISRKTGLRFIALECKNSIDGLNKIKNEFFQRYHGNKLYKLLAFGQKIVLDWSGDIQIILNLLDEAIEYYHFRFTKTHKTKFLSEKSLQNLSNETILKIFGKNLDKEPYLKFLYSLHSEEYKLIPVLEFIGNKNEESFLFRIKNRKGKLVVIWENLNPARATYFFRINPALSNMNKILDFIAEQEHGKRSFLRLPQNKQWAKELLGFIGLVEHNDMDTYVSEVHQFINR